MNISDIVVYIRSNVHPTEKRIVEDALRDIDGVIAPRFIDNSDNIMVVAYNPDKVPSSRFRETFDYMGLSARFVGM